MTKETWLPRFAMDDFLKDETIECDSFYPGKTAMGPVDAAAMANKRLEEFEAKCIVIESENESYLQTPSRIKDKRVTVEEIIEALRGRVRGNLANMQGIIQTHLALADRIEREGIINE